MFYLLHLLSFDELDLFDDESDGDEYDSGSTGTCTLPFRFDETISCVGDSAGRVDESIGRVSGIGSGFRP